MTIAEKLFMLQNKLVILEFKEKIQDNYSTHIFGLITDVPHISYIKFVRDAKHLLDYFKTYDKMLLENVHHEEYKIDDIKNVYLLNTEVPIKIINVFEQKSDTLQFLQQGK